MTDKETEKYWTSPPPEPSPGCVKWLAKIAAGWRPNSRIKGMGYAEAAEFYGVYIWELYNRIRPALKGLKKTCPTCHGQKRFIADCINGGSHFFNSIYPGLPKCLFCGMVLADNSGAACPTCNGEGVVP